ncbi:hypothetical protein AGOR_G00078580 [Albula goreensis]|uniref:Uncharacterized protein n=1 Tax=Albula goreensis TaxID=1534307 RepID=A0A8T3DNJ3_9TELE|nr:hypothetical protein AGOR_G00078580 [Albula goreensis]
MPLTRIYLLQSCVSERVLGFYTVMSLCAFHECKTNIAKVCSETDKGVVLLKKKNTFLFVLFLFLLFKFYKQCIYFYCKTQHPIPCPIIFHILNKFMRRYLFNGNQVSAAKIVLLQVANVRSLSMLACYRLPDR